MLVQVRPFLVSGLSENDFTQANRDSLEENWREESNKKLKLFHKLVKNDLDLGSLFPPALLLRRQQQLQRLFAQECSKISVQAGLTQGGN